jgi:hypothetical protein
VAVRGQILVVAADRGGRTCPTRRTECVNAPGHSVPGGAGANGGSGAGNENLLLAVVSTLRRHHLGSGKPLSWPRWVVARRVDGVLGLPVAQTFVVPTFR